MISAMTHYTAPFDELESSFLRHGIPIEDPGFYDHQEFISIEKQAPLFLNNYARFVSERPRDAAYEMHVRRTAPIMAREFHELLRRNGRLGACVDISGVLSRALEMEGIWNFVVKGSLTIEFPKKAKIGTRYFWSVDSGQFTAAHAWVVAPPFNVIDLTIQLQPYSSGEEKYLPAMICTDEVKTSSGSLEDIVAPQVRVLLSARSIPKNRQLEVACPEVPRFMSVFPAHVVQWGETKLKYVPVAITAPDVPFEAMCAITFEGKSGYEVYMQDIRPVLASPDHA